MQAHITENGLTVEGSQGQIVAKPLITEVRQYKAAMDTIRARSSASAAGAALVAKRWSSRPAPPRGGRSDLDSSAG